MQTIEDSSSECSNGEDNLKLMSALFESADQRHSEWLLSNQDTVEVNWQRGSLSVGIDSELPLPVDQLSLKDISIKDSMRYIALLTSAIQYSGYTLEEQGEMLQMLYEQYCQPT